MGKQLSTDDWIQWDGPFFWIKNKSLFGHDEVLLENEAVIEILSKWLNKNITGWFFYSNGFWMFEDKNDATTVKTFIITGYFDSEFGDIE